MREDTNYNIRILKGDFTTDPTGTKTIIREYHDRIFTNKFDNSDEMDKFLKKHKFI